MSDTRAVASKPLSVGVLMLISACYFAKDEGKKKIEEEGNVDRCP